MLRGFDLLLTSFPHYVERFRALGVDSEYLQIAFDERVTERLAGAASQRPRTPSGRTRPRSSAGSTLGGHREGTRLLERLVRSAGLDIWGYGADALEPRPCRCVRRHHGEAWGLDMFAVLAGSEIALNRHIDAAEGHANNMRLYEATGAGPAPHRPREPNLADLFEPGARWSSTTARRTSSTRCATTSPTTRNGSPSRRGPGAHAVGAHATRAASRRVGRDARGSGERVR